MNGQPLDSCSLGCQCIPEKHKFAVFHRCCAFALFQRCCALLRRQLARGLPALLRLLTSHLLTGSGDGGDPFCCTAGWPPRTIGLSCMHSCCSAAASVRACQTMQETIQEGSFHQFVSAFFLPSRAIASLRFLSEAPDNQPKKSWVSKTSESMHGDAYRNIRPVGTLFEFTFCELT